MAGKARTTKARTTKARTTKARTMGPAGPAQGRGAACAEM